MDPNPGPRVYVTGFGPFGNVRANSSEVLVRALAKDHRARRWLAGAKILPVEFGRCFRILRPLLAKAAPDALVCFGHSEGIRAISLERRARNLDVFRGGRGRVIKRTIVWGAPSRLPTRLPVGAIARALRRAGYPARYSDDAGGYVCNNLFYNVLRKARPRGISCGFIHVPPIGKAGWTEKRLLKAGREIVGGLVRFMGNPVGRR